MVNKLRSLNKNCTTFTKTLRSVELELKRYFFKIL